MSILHFIAKPFVWAHKSPGVNMVFEKLDTIIASVNKNVAVVGLCVGVVIVFLNVLMRYVFNSGFTWAEETARYCFLWSALFGSAYGFKKGVHIAIMMVVEKFPPVLAKSTIIFSHVLTSTYLLFMFYAGVSVVNLNYELGYMSEAFHDLPLWPFLLCLPLAFLGAGYRSVEKIYQVSWIDASEIASKQEAEMIHDSVDKK